MASIRSYMERKMQLLGFLPASASSLVVPYPAPDSQLLQKRNGDIAYVSLIRYLSNADAYSVTFSAFSEVSVHRAKRILKVVTQYVPNRRIGPSTLFYAFPASVSGKALGQKLSNNPRSMPEIDEILTCVESCLLSIHSAVDIAEFLDRRDGVFVWRPHFALPRAIHLVALHVSSGSDDTKIEALLCKHRRDVESDLLALEGGRNRSELYGKFIVSAITLAKKLE